jgi:hypothetical protein
MWLFTGHEAGPWEVSYRRPNDRAASLRKYAITMPVWEIALCSNNRREVA